MFCVSSGQSNLNFRFNDFLKEGINIGVNSKSYYAHRYDGNYETLKEHAERTLAVYNKIIVDYGLKKRLRNLYNAVFTEEEHEHLDFNEFANFIKLLVYFHDIGKVNPEFQKIKMNNNICEEINDIDSRHSRLSFILILLMIRNSAYFKLSNKILVKLVKKLIFLATTVDRHHTYLQNSNHLYNFVEEFKDDYKCYLGCLNKCNIINKQVIQKGIKNFHKYFDFDNIFVENSALFALYKLIYSLLIYSDVIATFYGADYKSYKLKMFDSDLKKSFISDLDNYLQTLDHSKKINKYREEFAKKACQRLKKSLKEDKRIFYLFLPTGSGKTLTSLRMASEILEVKRNVRRIYYVFPYINIIEQTKGVFDGIFSKKIISPIYSYTNWELEKKTSEGDENKYLLDLTTFNFPFIIMSNVSFFNAFIKNSKKPNYRFFEFANSIIIIDEVQSLNKKKWLLYNLVLTSIARYLNSYIIVMSATLPKLYMLSGEKERKYVGEIISEDDNDLTDLFKFFSKRVTFKILPNLSFDKDKMTLDDLINIIISNNFEKVLVVTNTVKKSRQIYDTLKETPPLKKYQLLLLNSTILPSRRREIIDLIKSADKKARYILVSTQSIEAGVDLDFEVGFREIAPIESIYQTAGRVNRNNKKKKAVLYVTKQSDIAKRLYSEDFKYQSYEYIVKNISRFNDFTFYKDFTLDIIRSIEKDNQLSLKENQKGYAFDVFKNRYENLSNVDVIEGIQTTIFVKGKIPINQSEYSKMKSVISSFNLNELIHPSGERIYFDSAQFLDKYKEHVLNVKDINKRKINLKKLAYLFSLCSFNTSSSSKKLSLERDCELDIYLVNLGENYDYERGLDVEKVTLNKAEIW
ncbi:MAG: CRISPR-associated helicase Cas3' [Candidatus Aenigmarchaeota archaeon]|nr:CRISPR-associated helicase Cas3' [Candidatus Aenigmarchaeota archaeon]